MNRFPATLRNVARCLVDLESGDASVSTATNTCTSVIAKLQSHLSNLMGSTGFNALLSRALILATADAPCLKSADVTSEGALTWKQSQEQVDEKEILEARIALLAQLLGLLVALIGPNVTRQLVSEIWPARSLNDLDFGGEDVHD